ncbi:MAG: hypothetical protein JWQ38_2285 [Flavipsychrobacter sp.]|nr:hypothetical protein [Flavipsychrobacter sp.]
MGLGYTPFTEENARLKNVHKPVFFRLAVDEDKKQFDALLANGHVFFHDELYDQLKQLIKSRNPSRTLDTDDYKRLIAEHLNGVDMDHYGVWVYYPWSHRLVHILDESEFIELRTSANKNKITIAERDILATKKVGVIGLSVGQSVSVTLAMERVCGELRLADFDELELNNLNRLRTGLHNLGILKVYIVAREIAEIDPYFKVVCYTDGITDDNIDAFFLDGGKLDAVIDECDGINIKILCRIKAKALNVPVLMEASDRATLDVERFDLEPGRPIMHGWLEHLTLDLDVLRNLKTNEEKIPYILPISGIDTLSARMQASMIEMRNTLTTWPQLATAVALGGALTADTCRRIFLGQYTDSGRYFIDLEQLIPDTRPKEKYTLPAMPSPVTDSAMKDLALQVKSVITPAAYIPTTDEVTEMVGAAIKAPSAGNSQPWKWYFHDSYLFLFYEYTDVISFGDFEQIASYIACGAALENLELKAYSLNLKTEIHLFPITARKEMVAVIGFHKGADGMSLHCPGELVEQIDIRHTDRGRRDRKDILPNIQSALHMAVASIPGAQLTLVTDQEKINAFSNIIGPVERLKLLEPAGHFEFYQQELRWNDDGNSVDNDGIDVDRLGISPQEIILLKMAKKPEVAALLKSWKGGQALEYSSRAAVGSASAIGIISMPGSSSEDYISGGRAMERMWLTATKNNIAIHPMMAPILYFARITQGKGAELSLSMKDELKSLYDQYLGLCDGINDREQVFLFKLGPSDDHAPISKRNPVNKILSFA